jgi:hypothetical protein
MQAIHGEYFSSIFHWELVLLFEAAKMVPLLAISGNSQTAISSSELVATDLFLLQIYVIATGQFPLSYRWLPATNCLQWVPYGQNLAGYLVSSR